MEAAGAGAGAAALRERQVSAHGAAALPAERDTPPAPAASCCVLCAAAMAAPHGAAAAVCEACCAASMQLAAAARLRVLGAGAPPPRSDAAPAARPASDAASDGGQASPGRSDAGSDAASDDDDATDAGSNTDANEDSSDDDVNAADEPPAVARSDGAAPSLGAAAAASHSAGEGSDAEAVTREAFHELCRTVLTLRCPRCAAAFVDFDGCFALTCGAVRAAAADADAAAPRQRCAAVFCGWCLTDCGDAAACHAHVRICPASRAPGSLVARRSLFHSAHRERRAAAAAAFIGDATARDAAARAALLAAAAPALAQLGIALRDSGDGGELQTTLFATEQSEDDNDEVDENQNAGLAVAPRCGAALAAPQQRRGQRGALRLREIDTNVMVARQPARVVHLDVDAALEPAPPLAPRGDSARAALARSEAARRAVADARSPLRLFR
jgi:hypothetical protein